MKAPSRRFEAFLSSSLISSELGKSTTARALHYTLATWGSGFVGTLSAVIPPLPLYNRCFAIITIPSSAGGESARLCSQQLLHTYHHNGQGWARETVLILCGTTRINKISNNCIRNVVLSIRSQIIPLNREYSLKQIY